MKSFHFKYRQTLLVCILLIALFFRAYDIIGRFEFAHDGDLYSWIVKDIVVNKHFRLIGQLTTAPGIFIGPLFYYILVPFFLIFKMDPVGALIPVLLFGLATVLSFYWVFSKLFNKTVGLIASFLYAVLLGPVYFDSRVVPSTPTNLWVIWYFYTVVMLVRGNYNVLPILGILAGLIWHIHIALAPALIAVPVAVVLGKKLPNIRQLLKFFVVFFIPPVPLVLFEVKHGFTQTTSFINNFAIQHGGGSGLEKFYLVIIKLAGNLNRLLFYPQGINFLPPILFVLLLLLLALILVWKKLLRWREVFLFYIWVGGIILYYTASSVVISEYYFANIEIVFLAITALLLFLVYQWSKWGKYLVVGVLLLVFTKNAVHWTTVDIYHKGYNERKSVAEYITNDSRQRGFPCVAVSYITKEGENVGFRYFFWLNNLHVNQPISGSPVYTIVLPIELAPDTVAARFGHIGVILPERIPSQEEIKKSCSGQNSNLTDPLFGYTE